MKIASEPGLLMMLFLVVFLGCGSDNPETLRVSGKITYQGAPVEGARVTFTPERGPLATGNTNAQGEYNLKTFEAGDGVVPGQQTVTVTKTQSTNPDDPYSPARQLLPLPYASSATSPLKVEVKKGEKNVFDFELQDG